MKVVPIIQSDVETFKANPRLKKVGQQIPLTHEQVQEYAKCAADPEYFILNYIEIVTSDEGVRPFTLRDYQKKMIRMMHKHNRVVIAAARQSGKTESCSAFILWLLLFNQDKTCAILANKETTATEIVGRVQGMYMRVPLWLQQGVDVWNTTSFLLENGSRLISSATSSDAIRGFRIDCISGDSLIDIKIGNIKRKLSLHQLENLLLCNNYKKYNINQGYYDSVSGQQIHENILEINEDEIRFSLFGGSSYNSEIDRRWRRTGEFCAFNSESTYVSSSFINKNVTTIERKKKYVTCDTSNENRQTRYNVENDRFSETPIFERHCGDNERKNDRIQTHRRIQKENIFGQYGKEVERRNEEKIIECSYGQNKNNAETSWNEYKQTIERKKENQRTCGQNKQESRENSQDGGKTSGNETFRGSKSQFKSGMGTQKTKPEFSCMEQREKGNPRNETDLYRSLEKEKIEVLTAEGYKRFSGLKIAYNKNVIKLKTSDCELICTPEHEIFGKDGWEKAKNLLNKDIKTVTGWQKVISIEETESVPVYDLLNVEDTNSFIANDILVHNCLFLDEYAHVANEVAEEFFTSVYPTISSGKTSKVIICSTPKGMNHFAKMFHDAVNHKKTKSQFKWIKVTWDQVPGRNKVWKQDMQLALGEEKFLQEQECEFVGSGGTLISSAALKKLYFLEPLAEKLEHKLKIYKEVVKGHRYVACCDVSQGKELDFSAMSVIDVTQMPYEVVATYHCNSIPAELYPDVIAQVAQYYNMAYVLVESNDIGTLVLKILIDDLEYENIIYSENDKAFKDIMASARTIKGPGLKTSNKTKRQGCNALKQLIERQELLTFDFETISELNSFVVKKNKTYAADEGKHDDLVSTLILFSWLSTQQLFKDLTATNARDKMYQTEQEALEAELPLPPVLVQSNPGPNKFKSDGCIWETVENDDRDLKWSGYSQFE